MNSRNDEATNISRELRDISLKIQHLQERKKIMCIFQEIRNRTNFGQTEEAYAKQQQINIIDNELRQLRQRQAELQKRFESTSAVTNRDDQTETAADPPRQEAKSDLSQKKVVFIEAPPPSFPAPAVILDTSKLPPEPSRTQCPECQQFVLTETITSISSVTWLVCVMIAMVGCVAGCCFIPFCSDKFKSITHRCPKCRASITTLKKL